MADEIDDEKWWKTDIFLISMIALGLLCFLSSSSIVGIFMFNKKDANVGGIPPFQWRN